MTEGGKGRGGLFNDTGRKGWHKGRGKMSVRDGVIEKKVKYMRGKERKISSVLSITTAALFTISWVGVGRWGRVAPPENP